MLRKKEKPKHCILMILLILLMPEVSNTTKPLKSLLFNTEYLFDKITNFVPQEKESSDWNNKTELPTENHNSVSSERSLNQNLYELFNKQLKNISKNNSDNSLKIFLTDIENTLKKIIQKTTNIDNKINAILNDTAKEANLNNKTNLNDDQVNCIYQNNKDNCETKEISLPTTNSNLLRNNSSNKAKENLNINIDNNYNQRDKIFDKSTTANSVIQTLKPVNKTSIFEDYTDLENNTLSQLILNFTKLYPIELWREHGFFTNDYLKLINPHWLQYPPTNKIVHYSLGCLYSLVFVTGITGNFLVIFMFIRCRSLRTPANTLIINLAISDLIMMSKMPLFIYNCLYLGPALGAFVCEMYGFIGGLTGTVSIVTLTAIAIDRYLVIIYPLDPNKRINGYKSKFCLLITWTYGIVFAGLPLVNVGVGKYIPEGLLTSCSFDYLSPEEKVKKFILIFFIAAWVLPLIIIVFCYSRILKVVVAAEQKSRCKKKGSISSRHCREEDKRRTEIKLAGVVIIVIFLWFIAWTPHAIVALLGISGYQNLITPTTSMVPALLAKFASCVDPYVYAVTHPRFQSEIRKMCLGISNRNQRNTFKESQYSLSANISEIHRHYPPVPPLQTPQEIRNDSLKSNRSETVEEIMVMVDLPTDRNYFINHQLHQLISENVDCFNKDNVINPPSWYVKPTFTRSSSFTSISRHLTFKKD